MADKNNSRLTERIEQAERLQDLMLDHFEKLLISGEITSTDLATLSRLLHQNGFTLNRADLPEKLQNKLTKIVEFDADEPGGIRIVS